MKTSRNDENFEFLLISQFKNFEKSPKLREMMKTLRNDENFDAAPCAAACPAALRVRVYTRTSALVCNPRV